MQQWDLMKSNLKISLIAPYIVFRIAQKYLNHEINGGKRRGKHLSPKKAILLYKDCPKIKSNKMHL